MRLGAGGIAALLVATASGAAGATETRGALYADLRFSVDYAEDNSAATGPTYNFTDNNSIWGVKASTVRGGVTVFGAYERFIEADEATQPFEVVQREAYLGMRSFCGTVKAGRHVTAYADAGRKLDPFFNTAVAGASGVASGTSLFGGGNSHGSSSLFNADYFGNAFVSDHVSYESPAFMGVTANAAIFMDETNTAEQSHSYGGGAEFRGAGLTAGAQFIDSNMQWGANVEAARLYLGYAQARFGLGASVEKIDLPSPGANANYLMLSGWYGLRTDTRLAFSFGLEDESGTEGDSLRAGIFHDVLENFTVWAAARRYNERVAANPDADVFTIGASYKFSLGFSS